MSISLKNPLQIHLIIVCDDKIGETTFVSVLQSKGEILDINYQYNGGLTALHMTAARSEPQLARLVDPSADLQLVTEDDRSVLHIACKARKSNIAGLAIEKSSEAMVDKTDSHSRTTLHVACALGRSESVSM